MIFSLLILSSVMLFLLIPFTTLIRYYSPAQYSAKRRVLWSMVTVITWPFVPIFMAWHKRDKVLLSLFWLAFLVFTVSACYWVAANVDQFIALEDKYLGFINSLTQAPK